MGKFYLVAKSWINGEGDDHVDENPFDPKSISSTNTFLFDTNDYEEISKMLENKAKEVSLDAKKNNKVGKTIINKIKNAISQKLLFEVNGDIIKSPTKTIKLSIISIIPFFIFTSYLSKCLRNYLFFNYYIL